MDLIYTDINRIDQGVLSAYALDLSYGAKENDFELTVSADSKMIPANAFVYMEGTEYGGIIDGIKASTGGKTITYTGRTWHGILNSKIIEPNAGDDHLVVSGDANTIVADIISRLGISGLFSAASSSSGITVKNYKFYRYCKGYDGIISMLKSYGGKLHISWQNRGIVLAAVAATDYTDAPIDGDIATLSLEINYNKVNHLVCLGAGELADREVLHLYADATGNIGKKQYYTGLSEVAEVYENAITDELEMDATTRFKELRGTDLAKIKPEESEGITFDIGDIVGATEYVTGLNLAQVVTQKIIKIKNGVESISYNVGG